MVGIGKEEHQDQMILPPGFRFHPTDEELITHYLCKKVQNGSFSATAMGEVDLNKCEPWDLPLRAKIDEKEWYFFCVRDRKYPTGLRTNRATKAGYWKATGKDKEIFRGKSLIGMKKTLVFYQGRAPKGEKTGWVMHEYRQEGKFSLHPLPATTHNEWVICRVFQKGCGGKKTPISSMMRKELNSSALPPLMDPSPYVPCFSNANLNFQRNPEKMVDSFKPPPETAPRNSPFSTSSISPDQGLPVHGNWQLSGPLSVQDQTHLMTLLQSQSSSDAAKQSLKTNGREMLCVSQETGVSSFGMGRRLFEGRKEEEEETPSAVPAEFPWLWD